MNLLGILVALATICIGIPLVAIIFHVDTTPKRDIIIKEYDYNIYGDD